MQEKSIANRGLGREGEGLGEGVGGGERDGGGEEDAICLRKRTNGEKEAISRGEGEREKDRV